jgi:EcsC protein family
MAEEERSALRSLGERLIDRVIEFGINGGGPLSGALTTAEEHLVATAGDREEAVRRLVAAHVRLAAVSGFVTGVGGIATLPVAVPAATAGLYIVATRMCAGIAYLRGYDVGTDEVRSAILVSLLGSAGASTLKRAGVEIGRRSTAVALERLPARLLIEINKRVGYSLIAKAGEKGVLNLAKLVPLVGGPIGAAVDGVSCKTIAAYALRTFDLRTGDSQSGDSQSRDPQSGPSLPATSSTA